MIGLLQVKRIITGKFKQNCYILSSASKECLIIDPGEDASKIVDYIQINELLPLAILNTHGHFDHVGAVKEIKVKYGVPFYFHADDMAILEKANFYAHFVDGVNPIDIPSVDCFLESGILDIGPFCVEVIHAPGHSGGSVCFRLDNLLFTGDTIFLHTIGRVDMPDGDIEKLRISLKLLSKLPPEIVLYPGHEGSFKLKDCLETNETLREVIS